MWGGTGAYDQGGGGGVGGGGFLDSSINSSPAGGNEQRSSRDRRAENVVPVTVKQILDSDEDFKIGDLHVHVLTFVGIVKDIDVAATKITYIMGDSSGQIKVVQFLDGAAEEEQPLKNAYYRVFGTVRASQGKHYVMAFKIRPVTDLNELTTHLLEVIDVHLNAPLIFSQLEVNNPTVTTKTDHLSNSMMGVANGDSVDSMGMSNSRHKMVVGVIGEMAQVEDSGVDVHFIAQKLKGKLNLTQVRESVDYLLQEGFIFTTVDDDHYTVTR